MFISLHFQYTHTLVHRTYGRTYTHRELLVFFSFSLYSHSCIYYCCWFCHTEPKFITNLFPSNFSFVLFVQFFFCGRVCVFHTIFCIQITKGHFIFVLTMVVFAPFLTSHFSRVSFLCISFWLNNRKMVMYLIVCNDIDDDDDDEHKPMKNCMERKMNCITYARMLNNIQNSIE